MEPEHGGMELVHSGMELVCGGMELQCGKMEWELAFCSFHSPIPRFFPSMCQAGELPGNTAMACNINYVCQSVNKIHSWAAYLVMIVHAGQVSPALITSDFNQPLQRHRV